MHSMKTYKQDNVDVLTQKYNTAKGYKKTQPARPHPYTAAPYDHDKGQTLDLCFGVGETKRFFNPSPKTHSHEESNPG
jgi:hypothetical protein